MTDHVVSAKGGDRKAARRKGVERRREILDAALMVFGRRGYRGASMREIAELVGMSTPGLLHHFGTKEALLTEVLRHRDRVDQEFLVDPEAHGLRVLLMLVEVARRNTRRRGLVELYCVLSAEATAPDHPAHQYFAERYAVNRDAIAGTFASLQRSGGLRTGVNPDRAARSMLAMMDGLQVQWLMDEASVDMARDLLAHLEDLLTEEVSEALTRHTDMPKATAPSRTTPITPTPAATPAWATGGKQPTVQDLAHATGVSIASVSRALNGKPGVSHETRAMVLAAAAQLGFTGSAAARALKMGRTERIAVTSPLLDGEYAALLLKGTSEELQAAGQSLVLGATAGDGGHLAPVLERIGRHGFDGVVLVLAPPDPAEYQALLAAGTPAVLVDPAGDPGIGLPIVACDNAGGARQAVEHLLALGHTRIGVVAGEPELMSTRERLRGVREALASADVPHHEDLVRHGSYQHAESGCAEATALLSGSNPPTAVFAFNDRLAAGVLQAAAQLGVDVPGHLSVVGFDDASASLLNPALTSVRQPLTRIGAAAARLLLDWLAGRDPRGTVQELPTELVVRASTAHLQI